MTARLELTIQSIEAARRQLSLPVCDVADLSFTRLALERLADALRRVPCVVVMGEVNSGKTSVANRLIASSVLPAAVIANTAIPVRLHYATSVSVAMLTADDRRVIDPLDPVLDLEDFNVEAIEVGLPEPRLKSFDLIDTPSKGDLTALADESDILIWCTNATRAWTETERRKVMEFPARFRRSSVLVATHADALSAEECDRVLERLNEATADLFSTVVLVSAAEDVLPPLQVAGHASPQIAALQARLDFLISRFSNRRARVGEQLLRRVARMSLKTLPEIDANSANQQANRECELAHALLSRLANYTALHRRVA
ncbi:protein of unknown function [Candidatus Filomicrobium marinum]|uniref:Dynamin N-terminal domain-containing protein n=1 Tax=Candidatus Filomicrobium marinum TaxID=1608628 RepID=A0A0D6JFK2_9HYPH|nr:dynamin family protein [Candidatus Filomicrobium marinum]CFX22244.1 protein of unknown function [Candidatus Filomicrobium marinum]CPR18888.1 protein of unknown function [Candidatus Filomicrobium marinum]